MRRKVIFLDIALPLLLASCSPHHQQKTYETVLMQRSDVMPTRAELYGIKNKIVVFPADTANTPLAEASNAGTAISATLETYLAKMGVEIVDPNIVTKLTNGLTLTEQKAQAAYEGPNILSYAITGIISNTSLSSAFNERREWTDDDGGVHVVNAYCLFKATVSANLNLHILPSLNISKTILVKDTASVRSDNNNSNCPINDATARPLVRKAAQGAVKSEIYQFQNFFAAKAYVLERRIRDGRSIFKIFTGNNLGFQSESTITFYNLSIKVNPITGYIKNEEYEIAQGTVIANLTGDDYAWVLVDDEKADEIKLGDYVKVKYGLNMFDELFLSI